MKLIHVEEPKHEEEIAYKKAREIARIKPDAVLFEYPTQKHHPLSGFNRYKPQAKPKSKIKGWKEGYKIASKRYPWLKSAYKIAEAVEQLWKEGKQIYLYEIDAPIELTSQQEKTRNQPLLNIVWNYLREKYMAENIKKAESEIKKKIDNPVVLVFCHDFHWKNLQFLLSSPNKDEIWDRYFVKSKINKTKEEIELEIGQKSKILDKYWKIKSDFA